MRDAKVSGYGATGDSTHPYHTEYTPDTYDLDPKTPDEIWGLFHKANEGFRQMHAYFAALAVSGDVQAMECWDEICKTLYHSGYYGFSNRNMTWQESVFNDNRVRKTV